jgi:peptidoglycan/LPS O-acetylase OafA/YrhL
VPNYPDPVGDHNQGGIEYVAGLDGLRALAVITVMAFHLGWSFVPGGAFGVSLFFTLSGYLITQVMLTDHARAGKVDLKRFWSRRLRRLAPGSIVCLIAVAVVALCGLLEGNRLRGDLFAALGYSANWRFATAGTTYAQLFESVPSPVLHFWSLAIEEQFYVIFPLLMIVLLRWRKVLVPTLALLAGASVAAMVLTNSRNLAYYGTHTRAAELLIGALLALVVPVSKQIRGFAAKGFAAVGVIAFGGFVFIATHAHTNDQWLYKGGLSAFSLISSALIIAVLVPGPIRVLMTSRPMVAIGRITYSLYLFHWPVFVVLNRDRMGFDGLALSATRVGVTFAFACLSAWLIENPIRFRKVLRQPVWAGVGMATAMGVALIVMTTISASTPIALAGVDAPDEMVQFAPPSTSISIETPTRDPLRVLVLGSEPVVADDVKNAIGDSIPIVIVSGIQPGCAIRPSAETIEGCESFTSVARRLILQSKPDVAVLSVGKAERKLLAELENNVLASTGSGVEKDSTLPFRLSVEIVNDILQPLVTIPVIIVDYGEKDVLSNDLDDAGMRLDNAITLHRPTAEALANQLILVDDKLQGADHRTRVMVIGDSTSFGISAAINNVAGDRFSVLWAGGRNCPFVEAEKVRWWDGAEFNMTNCATLHPEWDKAFETFAPSIVVMVYSVPEQAEQKYAGDETWYTIADSEFVARHDAAMQELVTACDERGIALLLLNSPEIHGGALSGAQFAQPERVTAWNALMQTWLTQWPEIHSVDWASIVTAAESAAGPLRGDGIHMVQSDLDVVVQSGIIPLLDAQTVG